MDVFTFVIIVVIIGCGTGVLSEYFKTKRKSQEFNSDDGVLDELDSLRQRVEVLEAIVTDEKYHLRKEIDQLERRA
jgi:hypothetical protein